LPQTDLPRQAQRRAAAGVEPALDLQHREPRVARRDPQVGVEQQFPAPGVAAALHGDDQRLGKPWSRDREGIDFAWADRERRAGRERIGPVVEVDARREVRSFRPDDAHPQVRVVLELVERAPQRVVHLATQGIHLLRAADAHEQRVVAAFDFDRHCTIPQRVALSRIMR